MAKRARLFEFHSSTVGTPRPSRLETQHSPSSSYDCATDSDTETGHSDGYCSNSSQSHTTVSEPASFDHNGSANYDGNCFNLHRQQLLDPPVLAIHSSFYSFAKKSTDNTMASPPSVGTVQPTDTIDDDSMSDTSTELPTVRRVHFAKYREIRRVSGLGPNFSSDKAHSARHVVTVKSRFEFASKQSRCHCGFTTGACECFSNTDYVSSYFFGECYPAFLDLPDEAARLEPSESGDRVMFDSGCPQQVPINH